MKEGLVTASIASQDGANVAIKGGREGRGYGSVIIMVSYGHDHTACGGGFDGGWLDEVRVQLLERKQLKCFRCQGLSSSSGMQGPGKTSGQPVAEAAG